MIRLQGAQDLCSSLASSRTLTQVDLSFNALDDEAGVVLGASLHENKVWLIDNSYFIIFCVEI